MYIVTSIFLPRTVSLFIIEKRIIMTNTNESAENYLETILILSKKLPVVRSVDISN